MKKKKATILPENVIFIILNVLFLVVLILFITKQGSGIINTEEAYAKQICLLIDSAKPVSVLKLNMEKAKKISESNKINFGEIVEIDNEKNRVFVKLSSDSGYSYSFFNDVNISHYGPEGEDYVFIINEK